MAYTNLPGVFIEKQDGGLQSPVVNTAPKILVLGTASKGDAETPYVVMRTKEAAVAFGSGGTLTRGLYEVKAAGGDNVVLFRIGATPAVLTGIGCDTSTDGIRIETAEKDDSASEDYEFYWDNTGHRLVVQNVSSGVVVYDRDFDDPLPTVDLGEVYVTGDFTVSEGVSIGSASAFLTLYDANATLPDDLDLVEGTDGTSLSRMELYEALYKGYVLLENEEFDHVVPMDVYLDDLNVADIDISGMSWADYPEAGEDDDILLYFYTEEANGQNYFWWRSTKLTGAPEIYPTGYATTSPNGVTLADQEFYEVNFAHQLATFCHDMTVNEFDCHGYIGVRPPTSLSLADVSSWVGKLPVYTRNSDDTYVIASAANDGTGLLGNKFMAGKYGFRSNVAGGGLIATDTGFVGGTEELDRGDHVIDIGACISVTGQWITLYNQFDTTGLGYRATMAPTYAGFVSVLDPKSAPTNKVIKTGTLPFRLSNAKLENLAGTKYVFCRGRPKGTTIADAPTAARIDSDFTRLTTVRCTKVVADTIREKSEPFIGEANSALQRAALQTALEKALAERQKQGYIQKIVNFSVSATPAQQVAGDALVQIQFVPPFEMRHITVVMSLSAM